MIFDALTYAILTIVIVLTAAVVHLARSNKNT